MLYRNMDDLCLAMSEAPLEQTTFISRCLKRYFDAKRIAPTFGLVGVGCITFAQNRLIEFQRRVHKFKYKIGAHVTVQSGPRLYDAEVTGYGLELGVPVYDLIDVYGKARWAYKGQVQ